MSKIRENGYPKLPILSRIDRMSATIEEVLKTVSFLSTKYDDLSGKIIKLEEENVPLKQKKTDT